MKRTENFSRQLKKFLLENKLDRYLTKKYFDYFLITFSVILGLYLNWEITSVGFFSLIIWLILRPLSSQSFTKMALFSILLVLVLLILKRTDRAESLAILAYCFLIFALIATLSENIWKENVQK